MKKIRLVPLVLVLVCTAVPLAVYGQGRWVKQIVAPGVTMSFPGQPDDLSVNKANPNYEYYHANTLASVWLFAAPVSEENREANAEKAIKKMVDFYVNAVRAGDPDATVEYTDGLHVIKIAGLSGFVKRFRVKALGVESGGEMRVLYDTKRWFASIAFSPDPHVVEIFLDSIQIK